MSARTDAAVVDASVAVKWFAQEVLTDEALRVPRAFLRLIAPDIIFTEVTSALLKKVRRHEMAGPLVHRAIDVLADRVATTSTLTLVRDAYDIAEKNGCSVYYAVYVVRALQEDCPLVTADERLVNALKPVYPGHLIWLGDVNENSLPRSG